jgi:hypothetical protein
MEIGNGRKPFLGMLHIDINLLAESMVSVC